MIEKFIPQFQPLIKEKWAKAVYNQIMSGWIGHGKTVEQFEFKIKQITGAHYAVSTTSGTAALMLAIHALNIPKNKKILFPSYTFLAGANAARFMGYEVDMVDINPNTLCMDVDLLRYKLREYYNRVSKENEVGAVIFVNHNGYVGEDIVHAKYFCDCYSIPMIEDSSQALGMPTAGSTGDIGIFSFSVPKIISTGQGGIMITNNSLYAQRACEMRDHGDNWRNTRIHNNIGINLKFDDIHAAYGIAQLEELDELLNERRRIYNVYVEELGEENIFKSQFQLSPWMIIYKTSNVQQIIDALKIKNIQAIQYYRPLYHNPPYAHLNNKNLKTQADFIYENTVYLPSSLSLTNEEIKEICRIIKTIDNRIYFKKSLNKF